MLHGYIPPDRFLPYLTWTEIEAIPDKDTTVILQPVGSIEQHGPHLPLVVDSAIGAAVVGRALEKLPPQIPAFAMPPLCYGKSNEHWHFPGTITLSAQTLMALLTEIGESLYRAGFRKLAFVTSHGGQPQVLEIVARDLHQRYPDVMVFPLSLWRVPTIAADLMSPKELEYGIHAGDGETSLMLEILPEQVRMDRAVCEFPQGLPTEGLLSMEGDLPFAWVIRDLSRSGVLGDATQATREKGQQLLESLADSWVQVIQDIRSFQQPQAWRDDAPL